MIYDNITLERQDTVAIVTMNRPDRRNSLSDPMLLDLIAALGELLDDQEVNAVVLTGAPPVFSAGAYTPTLKRSTSAAERQEAFGARKTQFRRLFDRATARLEQLDQPVICAVNGHAVGGGWGLTLPCDFRFASAEAEFWLPEVDLGVPLGISSTMRLVRMVGESLAKEIIIGCARYSADDLQAIRLVNQVMPKDDVLQAAVMYAQQLATKPVQATRQVKAQVNAIARTAMAPVVVDPSGLLSTTS